MTDQAQDRNQNDPSDFIEEAPDIETSSRDTGASGAAAQTDDDLIDDAVDPVPGGAPTGEAVEDVDPSTGGVGSP